MAAAAQLRLGEGLAEDGLIGDPVDVFFLERAELGETEDLSNAVAERRQRWERLAAPLDLGDPPKAIRKLVLGAGDAARTKPVSPDAVLVGEPASPGRASGAVRIVRGPEDFRLFQDGDATLRLRDGQAVTVDGGAGTVELGH